MNVILLKDHNDNKAGDIIDVTPERANYLVRCQVAEYSDGYVQVVDKKETKKGRSKKAKK